MTKIMVVDDEPHMVELVKAILELHKYEVITAYNGKDASEKIAVNLYDFVLLDLGLPDYNGLDLISEARKTGNNAAFIIITARGAVEDKVKGLNLGADDYLAKPFALMELLSRIHAVARRKFNISDQNLAIGEFTLELQSRRILCKGQEVIITKKEYDLLQYLVLNRNNVLTRNQLYEHIWGNILEDHFRGHHLG